MHTPSLVLASGSPRRAALLRSLGLRFTVRPPDIDESALVDEAAHDLVERLARSKATASCATGELVLGADTCVLIDGTILGKPTGADEATTMLRTLAGRTHRVVTGVAFTFGEHTASRVVASDVTFAAMSDDDIAWYVATGEPLDKAGAYGLQGPGARFVVSISGSPSNVIGLPLHVLSPLAAEVGQRLL